MLRSSLTRWDLAVLGRAAGGAILGLTLVALITAASDEGGVSSLERIGRALPVSPVCAALGVWGALGQVKARGETLALSALGRSFRQIGAPAVAGALAVCLASGVAIASARSVDVASFYPIASHPPSWEWRDGAFVDATHGLQMQADGTIGLSKERSGAAFSRVSIPPHGRIAAALATALAGVALALFAAKALLEPYGRFVDAAACILAAIVTVVLFQAAAARATPAWVSPIPAAALAIFAIRRYRASRVSGRRAAYSSPVREVMPLRSIASCSPQRRRWARFTRLARRGVASHSWRLRTFQSARFPMGQSAAVCAKCAPRQARRRVLGSFACLGLNRGPV